MPVDLKTYLNLLRWGLVETSPLSDAEAVDLASRSGFAICRPLGTGPAGELVLTTPDGRHENLVAEINEKKGAYATPEGAFTMLYHKAGRAVGTQATIALHATGLVHPGTLTREDAEKMAKTSGLAVLRFSTSRPGMIALTLPPNAEGKYSHLDITAAFASAHAPLTTPELAVKYITRNIWAGGLVHPVSGATLSGAGVGAEDEDPKPMFGAGATK